MNFSEKFCNSIFSDIKEIKKIRPLVLNITNQVVSNLSANILLSLGASPLMAHEEKELREIISLSRSLVINIGTLDEKQALSMNEAVKQANLHKIPIIIDPVGSGVSHFRTESVKQLLERSDLCILKGNASEINSLITLDIKSKGVDSLEKAEQAIESARELVRRYSLSSVVISGERDFVICSDKVSCHENGHEIMTQVTGMGCSLSTVVAAFNSVSTNSSQATRNAVSLFSIIGEIAQAKSSGPGSFQTSLLDTLFEFKNEDVMRRLRVREC